MKIYHSNGNSLSSLNKQSDEPSAVPTHLFLLSKTEVGKLVAVLSTSNHTEVITNLLLLEVLLGEVLQINSNDSLQPSGISWRKQ